MGTSINNVTAHATLFRTSPSLYKSLSAPCIHMVNNTAQKHVTGLCVCEKVIIC